MSNPAIFKTSVFGGFQKTAVLTYIDQLNADHQKRKTELDGKIAALEQQIAQLQAQVPTEEEKTAAEEQKQQTQQAQTLKQKHNKQKDKQQKTLAEKDAEIQQFAKRVHKLQFQAESHAFKAQKYDEIAMKIGTLVIDAKQRSDRIIAQAEEEAQKVTREKEERLEKMQGELQQFQQNVDQLRAQLKETLEWMDRKLERLGMLPQQEAALEPEEEKHTFAPFHLDQNFR